MWKILATFTLRFRLGIIIAIVGLTCFMGFHARKCEIAYTYAKLLPENDSVSINYEKFKTIFGQDGNVLVIGIEKTPLNKLENFQAWYDLGENYKKVNGIQEVLSIARLNDLSLNDTVGKFEFKPLLKQRPSSQKELDSVMGRINDLKFYEGKVFRDSANSTLMLVYFTKTSLNSIRRLSVTDSVVNFAKEFSKKTGIPVRFSGLPYIRTNMARKISNETAFFLGLAILVTGIILFIFFRNFYAVLFPLLVVVMGVVCSVGTIVLLGYKMTVLTGLIPPLMIVIGIPNCILLLNKYQSEFAKHGNKIRAMHTAIERISVSLFFANFTTSIGFAVFCAIENKILFEFGLVASINVMLTYLFSLLLVPIIFTYLPNPKGKHLKHLDGKFLNKILGKVDFWSVHRRKAVYLIVIVISAVAIYGITRIKPLGYVVDDLPKNDPVLDDMHYFEEKYGGVLPFEIAIDTKREGGVFSDNARALYRMNKVQKLIAKYPQFAKPVSIVEAVKFCYQSYRDGDPRFFKNLPSVTELRKIAEYVPGSNDENTPWQVIIRDTSIKEIHMYVAFSPERKKFFLDPEAGNAAKFPAEWEADSIVNVLTRLAPPTSNYVIEKRKFNALSAFIDSDRRYTRMSIPVRDIGSIEMKKLMGELKPRIDSAFNYNYETNEWMQEKDFYDVHLTGFSLMFLKGNDFLMDNLRESVLLAVALIALLMFSLFSSPRMIIISIVPSLVALLITAGLMGLANIPLKPSTILVFSIAFGISSDGTMYFLSKYRHELKRNKLKMSEAVSLTIRETGVSMIYTAFVLFFGFGMFSLSSFGGTAALGMLISFTLLVAYCSNLILLSRRLRAQTTQALSTPNTSQETKP
ncbi:MAG: MMPL family transporter [Bacteroidia bacterium]|nr:MMPL family transporter [Bacteroidia bacterium]